MIRVMQELLTKQIDSLKAKQMSVIVELETFATQFKQEYFNPKSVPSWAFRIWMEEAQHAWDSIDEFRQYVYLGKEFESFIETIELETDRIIQDFMGWTERKALTAKEIAEKYNRSTSTVYRWIKQGKLEARKNGRRWEILD